MQFQSVIVVAAIEYDCCRMQRIVLAVVFILRERDTKTTWTVSLEPSY